MTNQELKDLKDIRTDLEKHYSVKVKTYLMTSSEKKRKLSVIDQLITNHSPEKPDLNQRKINF